MYKLYINIVNGMYFCYKCGAKGSWFDFKRELGGFEVMSTKPVANNNMRNL